MRILWPRFGSLNPMDSHEAGQASGDGVRRDPVVTPQEEPPRTGGEAEPAAAEAAATEAADPGASRASLLLVDNDARIVELLTWFLSQRGFEVRTAGSFVEARERLAEGAPDLLVSDVDLGAESAVQELPRLRADGILPRTLVVSGYLDAAIKAALTALPEVVGTLAKPFEFTDLEAAIDRALWGEGAGGGASADPGDFEVPRPEEAPAASLEECQSGGGAAPDGDDDDDGWIEITPGS
jgi:ActR/RegA family two-component response regulator